MQQQDRKEYLRKKGQELRNLINSKKNNDSSVLLSDFLMQTNIHDATKQFKKYKNIVFDRKIKYTEEIKKHSDNLNKRTETLKLNLINHTKNLLGNQNMTEEEVIMNHKNCSPFKLCLPNDKPFFIRLKQNKSDKPINEKMIETLFPKKKESTITSQSYQDNIKIIESVMENINDLVKKYEFKIKIMKEMEKEIIQEFNIEGIDDVDTFITGSNISESAQNITNYVSSASEGSMEFESDENSLRHHPYNQNNQSSKKRDISKMTPGQLRELKLNEEFKKYDKGFLFFCFYFLFQDQS